MSLPDFLIIPSMIIEDKELQPLDGYVYGIVYWYSKLKLEKCIASNQEIAEKIGASASGISHSLTRLSRKKYIKVILNKELSSREEIIPLVSFSTKNEMELLIPSLKRATPLAQTSYPPSSNELQNKYRYNNIYIGGADKPQPHKNISYMRNLPLEDLQELISKFKLTEKEIKWEAEKAHDWLKSKGRLQKDYKAFLRNWLRNHVDFENQKKGKSLYDEKGFLITGYRKVS